jgi:ribosomal protein S18 acetylase RimI-like enzyme
MAISASISRLMSYYQRNGFASTSRRASLALKRFLSSSRMVIFYCDLDKQTIASPKMPDSLLVQRLKSYAELSPEDLKELTSFWNPRQAHRNIRERFEKGASLWLIKSGDTLAGFSWTLQGRTIAHYYFPMAQDDVQLFDFYVFPKFRGRAILWFLIVLILASVKEEGASRVFGDVAEWNQASLSFYRTIPFRRLGVARSVTVFGRTMVFWEGNKTVEQKQKNKQKNELKNVSIAATGPKGPKIGDLGTRGS